MRCVAILLAAGSGERFGRDKLELRVDGKPLWRHSLETFRMHPLVDEVGIVTREDKVQMLSEEAPEADWVVEGGKTRRESGACGLAAVGERSDILVLFHDAARPWVSPELVTRVIEAATEHGAAFPGLTPADTVKQNVDGKWMTLPRGHLALAQTPQAARADWYRQAFAAGDEATDDMALLEAQGFPVTAVEGDPRNRKITHPTDLDTMDLFHQPSDIRTGMGYDIHPFSNDASRPCWLGGLEFPGERALAGHSDADVALHALVDALLGAAGLGDIGEHYPPTEAELKDRNSAFFVTETVHQLRSRGWEILNADIALVAERPKIGPRRPEMRQRLAELLEISAERVNVKATTNEKLGAIGREEGVAALATVLIRR